MIFLAPILTALRKYIAIYVEYGTKAKYVVYKGRDYTVYSADIYANVHKVEQFILHLQIILAIHFLLFIFAPIIDIAMQWIMTNFLKQYCFSNYGAPLWNLNT